MEVTRCAVSLLRKRTKYRLFLDCALYNSAILCLAGVVVVVLVAFSYVILSLKILPVSGIILGELFL